VPRTSRRSRRDKERVRSELLAFMRAPMGYTMRVRARERPARRPRLSDVLVGTLVLTIFYGFIVVGAVLGWRLGHTAVTFIIGAAAGTAVTPAVLFLAGGIESSLRRTLRQRPDRPSPPRHP
jgi:hypothetical protein